MADKIDITINGQPHQVKTGAFLLAALQEAGVAVPTLCNHKDLTPNGSCRLCMVEVEEDGKTRLGEPKHWHVFSVVARKR